MSPQSRDGSSRDRRVMHFDIDQFLNPFLPRNPISRFPQPLARLLGHRPVPAKELGNIIISAWALLGAVLGLLLVAAVYRFSHELRKYDPPVLFASLGATAILDYNTIQSPLAQPRAAIIGHGLSAVTGVAVAKLFMLDPNFENIRWIAGPIACGLASFVMSMTKTVHPPGGATAVLASVDPTTINMGWMFVPFVILGSVLMFGMACLVNNIQRQFPIFWWTPYEVGSWWREGEQDCSPDIESLGSAVSETGEIDFKDDQIVQTLTGDINPSHVILLTADRLIIPNGIRVDRNIAQTLELLKNKLRDSLHSSDEHEKSDRASNDMPRMQTQDSEVTQVDDGNDR